MTDCGKRDELRSRIAAVSFAMDELRLFLDTHPGCAEALEAFAERMEERTGLVEEYTDKYGALDAYFVKTAYGWSWNRAPMPWRTERDS